MLAVRPQLGAERDRRAADRRRRRPDCRGAASTSLDVRGSAASWPPSSSTTCSRGLLDPGREDRVRPARCAPGSGRRTGDGRARAVVGRERPRRRRRGPPRCASAFRVGAARRPGDRDRRRRRARRLARAFLTRRRRSPRPTTSAGSEHDRAAQPARTPACRTTSRSRSSNWAVTDWRGLYQRLARAERPVMVVDRAAAAGDAAGAHRSARQVRVAVRAALARGAADGALDAAPARAGGLRGQQRAGVPRLPAAVRGSARSRSRILVAGPPAGRRPGRGRGGRVDQPARHQGPVSGLDRQRARRRPPSCVPLASTTPSHQPERMSGSSCPPGNPAIWEPNGRRPARTLRHLVGARRRARCRLRVPAPDRSHGRPSRHPRAAAGALRPSGRAPPLAGCSPILLGGFPCGRGRGSCASTPIRCPSMR